MKSFKKGILALGLTLGIIASVGGGSVFAQQIVSGRVNGNNAYGYSICYQFSATARTTYYGGTSALKTVNSVYTYIHPRTLATGAITKSRSTNNMLYTWVDLYAPGICKSAYITSTHVVYDNGQTWTGSTNHSYNI